MRRIDIAAVGSGAGDEVGVVKGDGWREGAGDDLGDVDLEVDGDEVGVESSEGNSLSSFSLRACFKFHKYVRYVVMF